MNGGLRIGFSHRGVHCLTMKTHLTPTRCATAAIAAVLALGSTGLSAQAAFPESQPQPVQQSPAEPAPANPQVVVPATNQPLFIPELAPQAVVIEPEPVPVVVTPSAPVEAAADNATRATTTRATARTAPRNPPVEAAEPAAATAEPFTPEVEPVFVPPVPLEPLDSAEPAITVAGGSPDLLDLLGYAVAALLVLALIAFIVRGTFRPKRHAARVAPRLQRLEQSELLEVPSPTPAFGIDANHAPVAPITAGAFATAGRASTALPRTIPTAYGERDALLKRMVAAAPDRANPFRSHKARVHRARLIIQSIGTHFNDRDPWIDLSAYPEIWPEVANRKFPRAA